MSTITCIECSFTATDADSAWDDAITNDKCPKCGAEINSEDAPVFKPNISSSSLAMNKNMTTPINTQKIVMSSKIQGTILGVVAMILWFMPLVHVKFMGVDAYQAGNHIGGIAYLQLFASFSYAILSWLEQHIPRIIASSVALAISLLFLVQAGSSVAWGLALLIGVSARNVIDALKDNSINSQPKG